MSASVTFQTFLDEHLAVVVPLSREVSLANWELQTTSSEEAKNRSIELGTRLAKIYANTQEYALLNALNPNAFDTPELTRQHTILRNAYLGSQMDESLIERIVALQIEIEDAYNIYRGKVGGREVSDNEIEDILQRSDISADRQEAWEASKRVGSEVEARVLELVRLRNEGARRVGFDNYYGMSLQLQELDETRLFELLESLGEQSEGIWNAYRDALDAQLGQRFGIAPEAVSAWHHSNRFFQAPDSGEANLDRFFENKDLEAMCARFFREIGLPIEDLLSQADLYERPGKCQHAFCMDVDRKGDVRVLCNMRDNERWMSVLLHEFGHAVYDKYTDPNLPYLLREPAHILSTEAIAILMGRYTKDAHWLSRYAGASLEEAQRIAQAAQRESRDQMLVFMRWALVMTHFERALYQDPEQDLNTLWWDLVECYQRVKRPEGRNSPDWAAKIHLATSPVYYHNYQLGEMAASQLLRYMAKEVVAEEGAVGMVSSPKLGDYLKERVFYPGALRSWEEWLEFATGEKLNAAYFVADLA